MLTDCILEFDTHDLDDWIGLVLSVVTTDFGHQALEVGRARDAVPPGEAVAAADALQQPLTFSVQLLYRSL